MESLIESGFIDAVADITTTEWADELVGGVLSAGPTRLDAAAKKTWSILVPWTPFQRNLGQENCMCTILQSH